MTEYRNIFYKVSDIIEALLIDLEERMNKFMEDNDLEGLSANLSVITNIDSKLILHILMSCVFSSAYDHHVHIANKMLNVDERSCELSTKTIFSEAWSLHQMLIKQDAKETVNTKGRWEHVKH